MLVPSFEEFLLTQVKTFFYVSCFVIANMTIVRTECVTTIHSVFVRDNKRFMNGTVAHNLNGYYYSYDIVYLWIVRVCRMLASPLKLNFFSVNLLWLHQTRLDITIASLP